MKLIDAVADVGIFPCPPESVGQRPYNHAGRFGVDATPENLGCCHAVADAGSHREVKRASKSEQERDNAPHSCAEEAR